MGVVSNHMGYAMGGNLQQGQWWGSLGQGRKQGEQSELGTQDKLPLPSCLRRGPAARDREKEGRERLKPISTYPQLPNTIRTAQGHQSWARHRTGPSAALPAASGAAPCPATTSPPPAC